MGTQEEGAGLVNCERCKAEGRVDVWIVLQFYCIRYGLIPQWPKVIMTEPRY